MGLEMKMTKAHLQSLSIFNMLLELLKNKYAFPAAVVGFLFICYQLAIKKTVLAWQINRQFKSELIASADIGSQPGYMVRKQKNLQAIVNRYSADSNAFRSAVISRTALIANQWNIVVSAVPMQEPALQTEKTAVERVNFNGSYVQLLQALQDIERADDIGLVRSVKFNAPRAIGQQGGRLLEMSVCLQVIKK
jgi:hypothetical protein